MSKRPFIFVVGLVIVLALRLIPITGQQRAGQQTNPSQASQNRTPNSIAPTAPTIPAQASDQLVANAIKEYAAQQVLPWWKDPDWYTVALTLFATVLAGLAWHSSQKQLKLAMSPRLYISEVRAVVEHGKIPVFLVAFTNDGSAPAKDTLLKIRTQRGGKYDYLGAKWSRDQKVTIPANSTREYFINWANLLHQQELDSFNSGSVPLEVSGTYTQLGSKAVTFCYKYFPWHGERPKGVSQFIPCDFNPGMTILIKAEGGIGLSGEASHTMIKQSDTTNEGAS